MSYNVAYIDGSFVMGLSFPDEETAHEWLFLQSSVKQEAPMLFGYVHASDGHYDRMTVVQRAFGQNWLNRINQLREMSQRFELKGLRDGLPPSIRKAEEDYLALRQT